MRNRNRNLATVKLPLQIFIGQLLLLLLLFWFSKKMRH